MSNSILVFEPHVDDALLQCNKILDQSINNIYIISMNNSDDRSNHSYRLLNKNIIPIMWGSEELRYEYHESFINYPMEFKNILNYNYQLFKKLFESFIIPIYQKINYIYLPVGLYHPHHIICSTILIKLFKEYKIFDKNIILYYDIVYRNLLLNDSICDLSLFKSKSLDINLKKTLITLFSFKHITNVENTIDKNYYLPILSMDDYLSLFKNSKFLNLYNNLFNYYKEIEND